VRTAKASPARLLASRLVQQCPLSADGGASVGTAANRPPDERCRVDKPDHGECAHPACRSMTHATNTKKLMSPSFRSSNRQRTNQSMATSNDGLACVSGHECAPSGVREHVSGLARMCREGLALGSWAVAAGRARSVRVEGDCHPNARLFGARFSNSSAGYRSRRVSWKRGRP
jgi:hypothetical protein